MPPDPTDAAVGSAPTQPLIGGVEGRCAAPGCARRGGSPWTVERARLLRRICTRVDEFRARKQSFTRAVRRPVLYWNGRSYKSNPRRCIRLSRGNLYRVYNRWVASGRNDSAFGLAYIFSRQPISKKVLRAFLAANSRPGVFSLRAAYRRMISDETSSEFKAAVHGPTARTLIEGLPPKLRAALRAAHRERRDLARKEHAANQRIRALANQF